MDFFAQQDAARRSTTRLVVLFGLAVVSITIAIELLLALVMGYIGRNPRTGALDWTAAADPALMAAAAIGTLVIIGGGSLFKIAQLRAGGRIVAEQLGGRQVFTDTTDPVERRLLNVVEEMALASGTPVPPVYLMDHESGINAFAAGFSPDDAVIGVTKGTATRLTRDELQGVIAHEFSHILNGDMRLNIRLMGLLHGILVIGMLGYWMLRVSFHSRGGGRGRGRNAGGAIIAIGAGLAVIGFAGTFFGNLIKAAVSRQREFLADASAVQFTREPGGLAGALKKIGGFISGSTIAHPKAPEASHMFFGRATSGLSGLFSTHPPLADRIRRIEPSWNGEFPSQVPAIDAQAAGGAVTGGAAALAGGAAGAILGLDRAVTHVGQPTPAHVAYARRLIAAMPAGLAGAAHESYGARAAVYGLLLDRRQELRTRQLAQLKASADQAVFFETLRLLPDLDGLDARLRLPLVEMALPALRALTADQHARFRRNLTALIEADAALDVFEWALSRLIARDLDAHHGRRPDPPVRHRTLADIENEAAVLLSVLARAGHADDARAMAAVARGAQKLGSAEVALLPAEATSFFALDRALAQLDAATPALKRRLLEAAAACIMFDRQVTASEAELLRAMSASIGCPMPPVL